MHYSFVHCLLSVYKPALIFNHIGTICYQIGCCSIVVLVFRNYFFYLIGGPKHKDNFTARYYCLYSVFFLPLCIFANLLLCLFYGYIHRVQAEFVMLVNSPRGKKGLKI